MERLASAAVATGSASLCAVEYEADTAWKRYPAAPTSVLHLRERVENGDDFAALARAHPQRFLGIASVDLLRPMEAVRELRRAVRVLGLRGLYIVLVVDSQLGVRRKGRGEQVGRASCRERV